MESKVAENGVLAELVGPNGSSSEQAVKTVSLVRLIFACTVQGGVQYGWALQLTLLTPYVQTLGLPHALSSLMWLCGPVAGFLVQPCVGLYSDRSRSRFGRRRPFILIGCLLICFSVIVVGYSSDIGYYLGDTKEDCRFYHGPRWGAVVIYVVGFWMLDFSNNTVQGPLRALMADLSGHHGFDTAGAIFSLWIALGNILGFSSGCTGEWHKWFPFLMSRACCEACANLKGAFLAAVVFLLISLVVTLVVAKEVPLSRTYVQGDEEYRRAGIIDLFKSIKNPPRGLPSVLLVTALSWASWFPYFLYNTDWMGREIFHGDPNGTPAQINTYNRGVREGAFGLLLNSVVLCIAAFFIKPLCRKFTTRAAWVAGNFILFMVLAAMVLVSFWSRNHYDGTLGGNGRVKDVALVLITILGVPLAALFTIPSAYAAQVAVTQGCGQGLCTGILNISVVIPQVIVAFSAGPWDALFGKGNIPAFALASGTALVCGIVSLLVLPNLSPTNVDSSSLQKQYMMEVDPIELDASCSQLKFHSTTREN